MLTKGRDFADYADQAVAVIDAVKELPGFRVLAVDTVMLNNAGSFISQELGFALAWVMSGWPPLQIKVCRSTKSLNE